MRIENPYIKIVLRSNDSLTTVAAAFPAQPMPVNEEFLWGQGYARLKEAGEYAFDPSTHELTSASMSYDVVTQLASNLQVTALNAGQLLAVAQIEKLTALSAKFDAMVAAGLNYAGKNTQIDDRSRSLVNGAVSLAQVAIAEGSGWDAGFKWRMTDNSWMDLATPEAMIAFGVAVGTYYSQLFFTAGAFKDAIAAAASAAAVNAIDINSGWPA